jgi:hypothetical protein
MLIGPSNTFSTTKWSYERAAEKNGTTRRLRAERAAEFWAQQSCSGALPLCAAVNDSTVQPS